MLTAMGGPARLALGALVGAGIAALVGFSALSGKGDLPVPPAPSDVGHIVVVKGSEPPSRVATPTGDAPTSTTTTTTVVTTTTTVAPTTTTTTAPTITTTTAAPTTTRQTTTTTHRPTTTTPTTTTTTRRPCGWWC